MNIDSFADVFPDNEAATRYDLFRPRNSEACVRAWKQVLGNLKSDKKLKALVLGPGSGVADVVPLQAATDGNIDIEFIGSVTPDCAVRGVQISVSWEEWLERLAWDQPGEYDIVAACQVFQHSAHWRLLMHAIHSVLKPRGILVIEQLDSEFLNAIQGFDDTKGATKYSDPFLQELVKWNRTREYQHGIVWRPHFHASGADLLTRALSLRGFEKVGETAPSISTSQISPSDWAHAKSKLEFGPLKWGSDSDGKLTPDAPTIAVPQGLSATQKYIWYEKRGADKQEGATFIGFGALSRLERSTRFDLHPSGDLFGERYLPSFAQALIQSSVLPVTTRLVLLFFGRLKDNEFEPFKNQIAIVDSRKDHRDKASVVLGEHLKHFPPENQLGPLTKFLLNEYRDETAFLLQKSDVWSVARKELTWGMGQGVHIEVPVEEHTCEHAEGILEDKMVFPPFVYSQYKVKQGGEPQVIQVSDDAKKLFVNLNLDPKLAEYAMAFGYLLSSYDVHILPLFQLLWAGRTPPDTMREYTGLGAIVVCTDRETNGVVYPEMSNDGAANPMMRTVLFREQIQAISAMARHFSQIAIIDQFRNEETKTAELEKAQAELTKQAQMLKLVEEPLIRISEALESIQEDTQELKAVMYDPSAALYSAAPLIKKYFVDGSWVGSHGLRWKVAHNYETIDSLIAGQDKEDQLRGRQLSLPAMILEIFGELAPWPKDEYDLCARARACIARDDSAFSSLKDQFLWLAGQTAQDLDKLLIPYKSGASPSQVGPILERIKKTIYRPYKDGDYGRFLLPLALLLRDSGTKEVLYNDIKLSIENSEVLQDTLINNKIPFVLPVPRYAHWLSFIHGVLSYVRADKPSATLNKVIIESADGTECCNWKFKLEFSTDIFDDRRDMVLHKMLDTAGAGSESKYHGNFVKPFLEFAAKFSGFEISKDNPKTEKQRFVVCHEDVAEHKGMWAKYACTTSIDLGNNVFSYEISSQPRK